MADAEIEQMRTGAKLMMGVILVVVVVTSTLLGAPSIGVAVLAYWVYAAVREYRSES
ncbi:MAG: hypothetical protein ABEI57_00630 [Halapricum sp.]